MSVPTITIQGERFDAVDLFNAEVRVRVVEGRSPKVNLTIREQDESAGSTFILDPNQADALARFLTAWAKRAGEAT